MFGFMVGLKGCCLRVLMILLNCRTGTGKNNSKKESKTLKIMEYHYS